MTQDRRDDTSEIRPGPRGDLGTEAELLELLPGYALGALEFEETERVERYLESHPEGQSQLQAFEQTAASLAHAAPRATLPARAKERLLSQINAELPAQTRKNPLLTPMTQPARAKMRGLRSIPRPQRAQQQEAGPRNWFDIFLRTFAIAGAVAAIALLAVITWQLGGRVEQLSTQLTDVQGQMTQLQTENTQLQASNVSLQEQVARHQAQWAALVEPQQTITLAGTPALPAASGTFFRREGQGVLILYGLPPLPADQSYQLWILPPDDGAPQPADLLPVANPAAATFEVALTPEHSALTGVGVSIEPAGGSQTPTTIVLLGTLSAVRA